MEPFHRITAVAAPLLRANIDTDAIIPSREIRTVGKTGLADGLFAGWRYADAAARVSDPDFVLNDPRFAAARILLAGDNFGCGSSREHAAWALLEYGFRAIVAPSFNAIFRGNCVRNGIVPVELATEAVALLANAAMKGEITIDLEAGVVASAAGDRFPFSIEEEAKQMLLHGLDLIDLTRTKADAIARFHASDPVARPWVYL